jgi:quercetin dioxygenase-like cupin family protein
METMTLSAASVVKSGSGKKMTVVGHDATIKLGSHQANGNYVFEVVSPAGMGIPPHVHQHEDELIYILSGDFEVFLDGKISKATAGDWLNFTRGTAHGFTNTGSLPGKTLWVVTPGKNFEAFFDELGALPAGPPNMDKLAKLFADYGLPLLPM